MRGITALLSGLVALWAAVGTASARETITWMTVDLPPAEIFEGDLAGRGFADQQLNILFAALPQYDHQIVRGTIARSWHELESRDGVCFNWVTRNADHPHAALYSRRAVANPSFRLMIKADHAGDFTPYADSAGEIDLERLARNGSLSGGYIASREYLAAVNGFIGSDERKTRLEKTMSTAQLVGLLHANRVDFVLSGPFEVAFYKETQHLPEDFVQFRIKGSPPYNEGYIACSAGPVGREVMSRLDGFLDKPEGWTAYVAPLRRWLDPAEYAFALSGKPR